MEKVCRRFVGSAWTYLAFCVLMAATVMSVWQPHFLFIPHTWKVLGTIAGITATCGWTARAVAQDWLKRKDTITGNERVRIVSGTITSAIETSALTGDARTYYQQIATTVVPLLLPDRRVRVGLYIVEVTALNEDTQEPDPYLWLAADNKPPRTMSPTVHRAASGDACTLMLERALGDRRLVVPDVTEGQDDWTAVPDTDAQRKKYMSFISVPVKTDARRAILTGGGNTPLGLLCVDSLERHGLSEEDLETCVILADIMSLGLHAFRRPPAPKRPSTLPVSPRLSVAGASVRIDQEAQPEGGQ